MIGRNSKEQIIRNGGKWLRRFPWQWFVTLTFAREVSMAVAQRRMKEFLGQLPKDAICFFVIEKHRFRNCSHLHALIGKVDELPAWEFGISKVLPYDPALGAAFYVTKFITEPYVWWDINAAVSDLT